MWLGETALVSVLMVLHYRLLFLLGRKKILSVITTHDYFPHQKVPTSNILGAGVTKVWMVLQKWLVLVNKSDLNEEYFRKLFLKTSQQGILTGRESC